MATCPPTKMRFPRLTPCLYGSWIGQSERPSGQTCSVSLLIPKRRDSSAVSLRRSNDVPAASPIMGPAMREAVGRWVDGWARGWATHDVELIRSLYAEGAVHSSAFFREPQPTADYAAWAFSDEESA